MTEILHIQSHCIILIFWGRLPVQGDGLCRTGKLNQLAMVMSWRCVIRSQQKPERTKLQYFIKKTRHIELGLDTSRWVTHSGTGCACKPENRYERYRLRYLSSTVSSEILTITEVNFEICYSVSSMNNQRWDKITELRI